MRVKPLALSIFLSVGLTTLVSPASANEMKKIFDYYAKGSPGTVDTSSMRHWTGASFSARNALNEPNLIQMPTVSMGGSCKGIDFHASGFGLISKDEIVQMARGIAQGAPGYFFNMAIGAICSSCLQNINEFMRKLEKFNELSRGSCQAFWDKTTSLFTSDKEKVAGQAEAQGGLLDAKMGFLTDWSAKLDEFYGDSEPGKSVGGTTNSSAAEVLNENVVFSRIKETFTNQFTINPAASSISTSELAMSLFGTVIIAAEPDSTAGVKIIKEVPGENISPRNLVFGTAETIKFWKCDAADPLNCMTLIPVADNDFVGLQPKFKEYLVGGGDSVDGIIGKIRRRENLDATELEFVKAFRMPYVKIAQLNNTQMIKDYAEMISLQMAQEHVNRLYTETSYALRRAIRREKIEQKIEFKDELLSYLAEAELSLEKLNVEIDGMVSKIQENVKTNLAVRNLIETTARGEKS